MRSIVRTRSWLAGYRWLLITIVSWQFSEETRMDVGILLALFPVSKIEEFPCFITVFYLTWFFFGLSWFYANSHWRLISKYALLLLILYITLYYIEKSRLIIFLIYEKIQFCNLLYIYHGINTLLLPLKI